MLPSPVGVGSRQCRLFRGMATFTNETNKHCVAIAAQPAGIKAAVHEEIRSVTARDQ